MSTDSAGRTPGRAPSASACEPYRELIAEALGRGRNAMAIWQDLVDDHGFAARYASVRRFVVTLRGDRAGRGARRHHDGARRGRPGRLRRGADGARPEHRQVPAHAALRPDARLLAQSRCGCWCGNRARRSGPSCTSAPFVGWAAPSRVIVLDNLREGVLTPDIYDPALNPLYRDVLAHYGVVALPCRVGDPDRKGKVEAGVGHAQKTPLHGLRFETLEEAQAYLDRWEAHWADTRIHGTTKRQVAVMFAEEQPALGPLPARAVSLLPLRRAHRASRWLRRSRGRVLRRAARLDRAARPGAVERPARPPARPEDRPAAARASARAARLASHRTTTIDPRARRRRRWRCSRARTTRRRRTSARCATHIHQHDGEPGVRRILGVLALAKKHGAGRRRGRRQGRARPRRADLSLPAPLPRTPPAGAADAAPGRSAHPPAHALSRSHRSQNRRPAHESRRTRSRPPQTPPLRHGRRPRNPAAPGADREARAARSRLGARRRRTAAPAGPAARAPAQAGALPRSRSLARHASISISTRR